MKKLVLSAALVAVFTGGMTGVVNVSAPGVASACEYQSSRSDALAAMLPQVNRGDHGRHVLALQLALRDEGYTYLRGSGFYSDLTARAVKDFQRGHGIRASGIVGAKTWHALVGPKPRNLTGGKLGPVPAFGIQPGERDDYKMAVLGNMLQRIHPYSAEAFSSGVYNASAQRVVRDFQRRAGIRDSGIVGPKTWAALDEVVSVTGHWGC